MQKLQQKLSNFTSKKLLNTNVYSKFEYFVFLSGFTLTHDLRYMSTNNRTFASKFKRNLGKLREFVLTFKSNALSRVKRKAKTALESTTHLYLHRLAEHE